jgi:LPXTG-motif cell wall-anchored protein
MKKSLTKAAAAVALAGALAFGAPLAANAYVPNGSITGPGTIAPGATGTFSFAAGVFEPGETVTFTLTGEGASAATLATVVKTAVETKSFAKAANADGSTSVAVTLHPAATGTYTLNVFSASTTASPISITAAAAAGGSDGSALPDTGTDSALMLGLWVGGGALLLAGGAIVVATTVRRQRQNAA